MPIHTYDQAKADAMATSLRRLADMIDRQEIQYVAALAVMTPHGGKVNGYALEQHIDVLEEIGFGTYLLKLGALRDFYLTAENQLMAVSMQTAEDIDPDGRKG